MPTAYSHKECPFVYCDSQDGDCIKQGRCHYAPIDEPAATIQAIREATNRHTQSPEAAREFLQESGIEEEALRLDAAHDYASAMVWINRDPDAQQAFYEYTSRQSFIAGAKWAARQTAALQAEKAELLEALREIASGGQEALDYKDGSGKPILQEAIWKAEAILSKHTK